MKKPLFEVKHLKTYFPLYRGIFRRRVGDIKAVDDISFSVDEQHIVGLVGESGCGKSTAARSAIRLIEPTAGEVYFAGKNLMTASGKELRALRQKIQMVFQDPLASLNPRKTVLDNVGEALLYHNLVASREEQIVQVIKILKQVGIPENALNQYPHQFSGGQQQRLSIGRALAMKPKLLICDEALSALDLSVQAQILNLLYDLKHHHKLSYLFISHDLSVVRNLCSVVLVMYQGKIVESGPVEAIFEAPRHPYTQTLLRACRPRHPRQRC